MLLSMDQTYHINSPYVTALPYLKREIDTLLESGSGGYIMEYYHPPCAVTDYLVGVWGFGKPIIKEVSLTKKRIVFEYPSKLRMKVFLHIQWDNLCINNYRIVKECSINGSTR